MQLYAQQIRGNMQQQLQEAGSTWAEYAQVRTGHILDTHAGSLYMVKCYGLVHAAQHTLGLPTAIPSLT